jgi:hypothetical protein
MTIQGTENLTWYDLGIELQRGGKFIIFQFCLSFVVVTLKRGSDVYFIRAGESAALKGIGYTLLTLILGWWGFPWGPIYTIEALVTNLSGGKDVTTEIVDSLRESNA